MKRSRRTDIASLVVEAAPAAVYRALVDPVALVSWLPPHGMSGQVHEFDARPGGRLRMTLTHDDPSDATPGKWSADSDVIAAEFAELVPGERVVWLVEFESQDLSFGGVMRMSWMLSVAAGGTEVTVRAEDVPPGIRQEDHDAGLKASLANLARFVGGS